MNELLAPLYYMFSTDTDRTSAKYAEADAFYCFVNLISDFRDHFCQQLDNSNSGIKATIGRLVQLLEATDPDLAAHLAANKVRPLGKKKGRGNHWAARGSGGAGWDPRFPMAAGAMMRHARAHGFRPYPQHHQPQACTYLQHQFACRCDTCPHLPVPVCAC